MNSTTKTIILWIIVVMVLIFVARLIPFNTPNIADITFSEHLNDIEAGNVGEVTLTGNHIEGKYRDEPSSKFQTYMPDYDEYVAILRTNHVKITAHKPSENTWMTYLFSYAPILLLIGVWIFFMRQMQGSGSKALSFGKSKAKLLSNQHKKVTFKDVAGVEEAQEELQEIIEFLKEPQKFQKLGGKIPKGVLLMGPPGTGKTLLARAIAGEANVPFFSISGSDFVEMFVGVGASRVRDLFEQGKKNAPCIIFIDEIDAVGRHRGAGLGGGHDEREQTLNQLLVEMDGFDFNEGVILIAATNRPDVLDPALLRPGRFDRRVVVDRPDIGGRDAILQVHTRQIPLHDDVELKVLARGTPGFTGADIANLVNEAALNAARYNQQSVCMEDFEIAKDKVLMGAERKSLCLSDEEKRVTAFHEAGHALIGALLPEADPIHKVTIIPRGRTLGATQLLPLDDRHNYNKHYLEAQLAIMMGGRISEDTFCGDISTGAGGDIEAATDLARKMVCEWGMSDLGPLTFGKKDEAIFLGKELSTHKNYSEETAIKIDSEIKRLVNTAYAIATKIITENKDALQRIADTLLEREVLDGEEIQLLIDGKELSEFKKPPVKTEKQATEEKPTSDEGKTTEGRISSTTEGSMEGA
ncbi:ATP-dependent zinc metalloprotease FtsH [Acidobacteriota bacterium]